MKTYIITTDSNSFLFYGLVIFHHIYVYVYMFHVFFIHSSINGYLGCFHVLTVLNSTTMNIGVHVSY